MPVGILAQPSDLGERTLARYADAPALERMMLGLRWRSCPLEDVIAEVPAAGRVLEVGCGHGLIGAALALDSNHRAVIGIDIDAEKIAIATAAAPPGVVFETVEIGEMPDGPFDAIVIVDVCYLLNTAEVRALVRQCADLLALGGRLILKETGRRPRWKFGWCWLQEQLAVRVFRITAGDHIRFLPPARLAEMMSEQGLEVRGRPLHKGYLHPHHLLVGERPARQAPPRAAPRP